MITVEQYLPYIEWELGVPSPEHVAAAEEQALEALVDAFAAEMKAKLIAKMREGYGGWDDPELEGVLLDKLNNHVWRQGREGSQMVDVANLAAMVWNIERERGFRRSA